MQKSVITGFYRSVVILFLSMLKDQRGIFLIVEAQTPLYCLDGSVTVKYCTVHALDGQQMLSQGGKNKICVYIAYWNIRMTYILFLRIVHCVLF